MPQIIVRDRYSADVFVPSPLRGVAGPSELPFRGTGAGVPSTGSLPKSSGSDRTSDAGSELGSLGARRDGVEPREPRARRPRPAELGERLDAPRRGGAASELVRGTSVSRGSLESGSPEGNALSGEGGASLCGGSEERGGDDMSAVLRARAGERRETCAQLGCCRDVGIQQYRNAPSGSVEREQT